MGDSPVKPARGFHFGITRDVRFRPSRSDEFSSFWHTTRHFVYELYNVFAPWPMNSLLSSRKRSATAHWMWMTLVMRHPLTSSLSAGYPTRWLSRVRGPVSCRVPFSLGHRPYPFTLV